MVEESWVTFVYNIYISVWYIYHIYIQWLSIDYIWYDDINYVCFWILRSIFLYSSTNQILQFSKSKHFLGLVFVLSCILVGVLCCRISRNLRELVGMIRNLSSLKRQCLNTSWTNGTWKKLISKKNVDRKIDIVTSDMTPTFPGMGRMKIPARRPTVVMWSML